MSQVEKIRNRGAKPRLYPDAILLTTSGRPPSIPKVHPTSLDIVPRQGPIAMTGPRRSLRLLFLGSAAAAAFVLAIAPRAGAAGASCEKGTVTGTLEIGDGSTPPCEFVDLWAVPD